ncbi:hypothetical protein WT27_28825 [Burkholderia territorii]|uniref:Uncharacterized protein n=1 Tax=Burkholderia territorii TaxID=1503055 RepID=A0A119AWU3_9BURK|nr:hypothetical protein WT27_28825 [Burkholderia territorii]KVX28024.1 hypothetical protein WT31_14145 [Burkholderia territorii]
MLPKDVLPWLIWRFLFRARRDEGEAELGTGGQAALPECGVIDRQSVQVPSANERGDIAGKRVVGHKRHSAVDTDRRGSYA